MIIFIHEDRAYLSWVAHHRDGFVVDWLRKPTRKHPVLHRAACSEIKKTSSKSTHWTTGRHLKACSQDLDELRAWMHDEGSTRPEVCPHCHPLQLSTSSADDRHLTTLSSEALEYVLEVAVSGRPRGWDARTARRFVATDLRLREAADPVVPGAVAPVMESEESADEAAEHPARFEVEETPPTTEPDVATDDASETGPTVETTQPAVREIDDDRPLRPIQPAKKPDH